MYRPFLFIGIGAVLASLALFYSLPAALFCIIFSAFMAIICIAFKKNSLNKGVVIALIFIITAVRFITLSLMVENKTEKLVGKTADINAEIIEVDYDTDNFTMLSLKVQNSTQEEAQGIKLKATVMHHVDLLPGDVLSARVVFSLPSDKYRDTNFGEGYYYAADIDKIYSHAPNNKSVWSLIHKIRTKIASAIDSAGFDEQSAVLKALIIGDKRDVSAEFSACVKKAGVSHMLVVSGMHLGIICGVMMGILKRKTKPVVAIIIGGIGAVFMLTVCLFHVSILRASIAYLIMLLARLLKRTADPLSALGFGIVTAVILMPYIFYNVAFVLSISATFAVLYPARILINAVNFEKFGLFGKVFEYGYNIIIISVCSTICTLPFVVKYFGYVALAAPITNFVVSFTISCALIIGVLAVLLYFLPFGNYISLPFFFVARLFAGFFISAVGFIGKEGFGVLLVPRDKNIYCFLVTGAFILFVALLGRRLKNRKEISYAK